MSLTDEYKVLDDDYQKIIEKETNEYHAKIQEYIEDLKDKRSALDNLGGADGDYLDGLTAE